MLIWLKNQGKVRYRTFQLRFGDSRRPSKGFAKRVFETKSSPCMLKDFYSRQRSLLGLLQVSDDLDTLTPSKNYPSSTENEADRTTELFHRVKQGSLSYTSEIRARSGSTELSQADDVNTETLRRLAPSAEPWAQHGNLPTVFLTLS